MLTPKEAEALANKSVESYINECGCETERDVANALMKLASMCGLGMCAVVGQDDAVARMQGTTDFLARPQSSGQWQKHSIN